MRPKASRKKKIVKIKAEVNYTETGGKKQNNETRSWFFKKIYKINRSLVRLNQKERE